MKKTAKIELIIVIVLIVVSIVSYVYMRTTIKKSDEEQINTEVVGLRDVNRFFTIDSAISKYFSYVTSKNSDAILKILDKDYVERNNITANNVYDFVGNYEFNIKSNLEEAYQISSYDNIYKYYVKVALKLETLYDSTLQRYVYYIVTINENELTFAVEPISSSMYDDKVKGDGK